jgi:hypothetical protein
MWTAAADPCVLRAGVVGVPEPVGIDLSRFPHCVRRDDDVWRVRLDLPDGALRLDLVEGSMAGSVLVEPVIDLRRPLEPQLESIRRLSALFRRESQPLPDQRLVRLVEALRAADALAAGASLRDIGLGVLGADWPGDGDHLKSRARRRIALAADLIRAGPHAVISRRI